MQPGGMALLKEDPILIAGIRVGDVADVLRSEPALAWFVAQGLWLTQPLLEAFWPQDRIAELAEMLESVRQPASAADRPEGNQEP